MVRMKRMSWIAVVAVLAMAVPQVVAVDDGGPVFKHGVVVKEPAGNQGPSAQTLPKQRAASALDVVVVDSQGTDYLKKTIWAELNANWANYGATQVIIDYTSLNMENITYTDIAATGADILVVSCAGPYTHEYTLSEVAAITQYVQEGHGIVITYYSLAKNNAQLAPLVGIDTNNTLNTNYYPSGIDYDLIDPSHPVFTMVPDPYHTGVPYMATPGIYPMQWPLTTGIMIANAITNTGGYLKEGAIVKNEVSTHRGIYFSHYIEDQEDGSNTNDKQTFYNALIWVAAMGEPLSIDVDTISATTGGTVNYSLDAGPSNAARKYLLLGGVTGTSPGTPLPGGFATLPVNWDAFTNLVISFLNSSNFMNFMGTLDPQGTGAATLNVAGPLPPAAVGLVMYYAFALANPYDFASNAVEITIVN